MLTGADLEYFLRGTISYILYYKYNISNTIKSMFWCALNLIQSFESEFKANKLVIQNNENNGGHRFST